MYVLEDISSIKLSPPHNATQIIDGFTRLDFHEFGVYKTTYVHDYVPFYGNTWLYVNQTSQITGLFWALPDGKIKVRFVSFFPDKSCMQTMYPDGNTISESDFLSSTHSISLEGAFWSHEKQVSNWSQTHGSSIVINTVEVFSQLDQPHSQRYIHNQLRWSVVGPGFTIVHAAMLLGGGILGIANNNSLIPLLPFAISVAFVVIVYVLGTRTKKQKTKSKST